MSLRVSCAKFNAISRSLPFTTTIITTSAKRTRLPRRTPFSQIKASKSSVPCMPENQSALRYFAGCDLFTVRALQA